MAKIISNDINADDYDIRQEHARVAYPDVMIGGKRLNRGVAEIRITGDLESEDTRSVRSAWNDALLPSTLDRNAPVIFLGWPTHGPFVSAPHGVYFDGYLAVAQKVLDERHPRFKKMLNDLEDAGVMLRREIATDDYLARDPDNLVRTPADLAALWDRTLSQRWPVDGGYDTFFSSSGAEAGEAAIKLAFQVKYKTFLEQFGETTFQAVQAELGHSPVPYFDRDATLDDHWVYDDYPFALIGCEGAFHGRTHGVLSLTCSKRAHRLAYPHLWQVYAVPFNAADDVVRSAVDWRELGELLKTPGKLRRVMREERKIPKDLLAGCMAEPFQGEGGYVPAQPAFFQSLRRVCDEAGALLITDEVQTIARTGKLFMTEHLGVRPDVVCTAKSMVIGTTVAPSRLSKYCHNGWHSNTWGSGRVFDTNFAFHTLDTLLHHKDPVLGGLTYVQNTEVKGRYLAEGLDRLQEKHADIVVGQRGYGLMRAILVRRREEVLEAAWKRGLKLLGCGWKGDVAGIRLLMLADTLAREVDAFLHAFDLALTDVSKA